MALKSLSDIDENLLKRIVNAITKALGPDMRDFQETYPTDTQNGYGLQRGNFINTNLRSLEKDIPDLILKDFSRGPWEGRLLLLRNLKITMSIMTRSTFKSITSQVRDWPHYLKTILSIENSGIKSAYDEPSLFNHFSENTQFPRDVYKKDYESITGVESEEISQFTHVVIVYEFDSGEIINMEALLLTPEFKISESRSLMEMVETDFAHLTAETFPADEIQPDAHSLVKIKNKDQIVKIINVKSDSKDDEGGK